MFAVLREVTDAQGGRVSGGVDLDRLAAQGYRPRAYGVGTDQGPGHLGAPGSHESGKAEDLTLVQLEAHILEQALGRQPVHRQEDLPVVTQVFRPGVVGDLPAHHQRDDLPHGRGRRLAGVDVAAVPDHGDPVRDGLQLVNPVGDVDDAGLGGPEAPDQVVQHRDLGVVQRRGRLVHDEDLGVMGQGLGDLDGLLLRDRQRAHQCSGVQRQLQPVDEFPSCPVERTVVGEDSPAPGFPTDVDVLGDGQVGHQVELLVDDADAALLGLLGVDGDEFLAVEHESAGVRGVDPGQQLHQRRLSGAVLPHECEDLAVPQGQVHVGEGPDAGEGLADSVHGQQQVLLRRRSGALLRCRGHGCSSGVVVTTPLRSSAFP